MHQYSHRASLSICMVALAACSPSNSGSKAGEQDLRSEAQKLGYAIGFDFGQSLAPVKNQVDSPAIQAGIEDGLWGLPPRLTDAQRRESKATTAQGLRDQQRSAYQATAKQNETMQDNFLADNARRPGVRVTASGLQYEVIEERPGPHPGLHDKVIVNYAGKLLDGSIFDSSYERHQPATLPVSGVVPGWGEALQLMSPGSKYKFYIPASLAYGERGLSPKVGPNTCLILEIEMLSIEMPAAAPAPGTQKK